MAPTGSSKLAMYRGRFSKVFLEKCLTFLESHVCRTLISLITWTPGQPFRKQLRVL